MSVNVDYFITTNPFENNNQTAKETNERDNNNNDPPSALFLRINYRLWDLTSSLIKSDPDEIKKWIVSSPSQVERWRYLPIHLLCRCNGQPIPPLSLFQLFVDLYPMGLQYADHKQNLPIHLLCKNICLNKEIDIIMLIAKNYPEGLGIVDDDYQTPIDILKNDSNFSSLAEKQEIVDSLNQMYIPYSKGNGPVSSSNQQTETTITKQSSSSSPSFSQNNEETETKLLKAEDTINNLRSELETLLVDDEDSSNIMKLLTSSSHVSSSDDMSFSFLQEMKVDKGDEFFNVAPAKKSKRSKVMDSRDSLSQHESKLQFHTSSEEEQRADYSFHSIPSGITNDEERENTLITPKASKESLFSNYEAKISYPINSVEITPEMYEVNKPKHSTHQEHENATILSLRNEISLHLNTINGLNESLSEHKSKSNQTIKGLQKDNTRLKEETSTYKIQNEKIRNELSSMINNHTKIESDNDDSKVIQTNGMLQKENESLMMVLSNLRKELSKNHNVINDLSNKQIELHKDHISTKTKLDDNMNDIKVENQKLQSENEALHEEMKEKADKFKSITSSNDNLLMDNVLLKKDVVIIQEKLGMVFKSLELIASDLSIDTHSSRLRNLSHDKQYLVSVDSDDDFDINLPNVVRRKILDLLKENSNLKNNKYFESTIGQESTGKELIKVKANDSNDNCPMCEELSTEVVSLKQHLQTMEEELSYRRKNEYNLKEKIQAEYEEKCDQIVNEKKRYHHDMVDLKDLLNKTRKDNTLIKSKNDELSWMYENLVDENTTLTRKLMNSEEEFSSKRDKIMTVHVKLQEEYATLKDDYEIQGQKFQSEQKAWKEEMKKLETLLHESYNIGKKDSDSAGKQIDTMQKENVHLRNILSNTQVKYSKLEELSKEMSSTCKNLQNENESLRYKSNEYKQQGQSEVNMYKKQVEGMLQYKDALQTENIVMRNEINKLNTENSSLRIKVEELTAREEKILYEHESIHNELADTKEALLTEIALMTDKVNDYEETAQSLNDKVQQLTIENDRVKIAYDDIKTEYKVRTKTYQEEMKRMKLMKKNLTNDVHNLQQSINQVSNQKSSIEERYRDATHYINKLEDENQYLEEKLSLMTQNYDALDIEKQTLSDEIQNFESRHEQTIKEIFEDRKRDRDNIVNLKKTCDGLRNEQLSLQMGNDELKGKVKTLESELTSVDSNFTKMCEEHAQSISLVESQRDEARSENEMLRKRNDTLDLEIQQAHDDAKSENQMLRKRIDDLEQELQQCHDDAEEEREMLRKRIDTLDIELQQCHNELRETKQKFEAALQDNDEAEENYDTEKMGLVTRNESLLTTINHLETLISEKDGLHDNQMKEIMQLEADKLTLKGEIDDVNEQMTGQQDIINELRIELRAQFEKYKGKADLCELNLEENNELKTNNLRLEEKIQQLKDKIASQEVSMQDLRNNAIEHATKIGASELEIRAKSALLNRLETDNAIHKQESNRLQQKLKSAKIGNDYSSDSCSQLYSKTSDIMESIEIENICLQQTIALLIDGLQSNVDGNGGNEELLLKISSWNTILRNVDMNRKNEYDYISKNAKLQSEIESLNEYQRYISDNIKALVEKSVHLEKVDQSHVLWHNIPGGQHENGAVDRDLIEINLKRLKKYMDPANILMKDDLSNIESSQIASYTDEVDSLRLTINSHTPKIKALKSCALNTKNMIARFKTQYLQMDDAYDKSNSYI